ncbi:MAG: TonB-dependent receptor plug domain-containing protein, partial [Sphingomonadaceae bacterium]|nr:TonB-dependent receptor plug domain-containing protein [Sphingomonadaceae bacterium]
MMRIDLGRVCLRRVSVSLVAIAWASTAQAQVTEQGPATVEEVADTSDEIVVTARQRSEALQDVPASITAFVETDIKTANITRPSDFIGLTPGVSQVQSLEVGDLQVNIRGINSGRDTESSVA